MTVQTGPIWTVAMKRALIAAVAAALGSIALTLPVTDDWRIIVGSALGAAVAVFIQRGGFEGIVDSRRAKAGKVQASDVPVVIQKATGGG